MSLSADLLDDISQRFNIMQGENESVESWKTRAVYSAIGTMGYASLYGHDDDGMPLSIIRFKRNLLNLTESYLAVYPELIPEFPADSRRIEMTEGMINIYLQTGTIYHMPGRYVPSHRKEKSIQNIAFVRSPNLDEECFVSGLGFYNISKMEDDSAEDLFDMYGIDRAPIQSRWSDALIESHTWYELNTTGSKEFLNLNLSRDPHTWVSKAPQYDKPSLMRVVQNGIPLVFLYRIVNGKYLVCELPEWRVGGTDHIIKEYRNIAWGILASNNWDPPIKYRLNGNIVEIETHYLLPPKEQFFMELYSWPSDLHRFPSNYIRIMAKEVFDSFKYIMQKLGYTLNQY